MLLLLTAFTLITLDYQRSGTSPLTGVRSAAATVFGPVERAAAAVVRPVSEFVTNLGDLGEHQDRIDELQAENDRLRQDNRTSELARNRAAELDELLRVAGAGQYRRAAGPGHRGRGRRRSSPGRSPSTPAPATASAAT